MTPKRAWGWREVGGISGCWNGAKLSSSMHRTASFRTKKRNGPEDPGGEGFPWWWWRDHEMGTNIFWLGGSNKQANAVWWFPQDDKEITSDDRDEARHFFCLQGSMSLSMCVGRWARYEATKTCCTSSQWERKTICIYIFRLCFFPLYVILILCQCRCKMHRTIYSKGTYVTSISPQKLNQKNQTRGGNPYSTASRLVNSSFWLDINA